MAIDDYASSNQLWVASSTDGGQTWSAPKAPSGATGALPNGIVTLPDGTAVIGYGRVIGGNDNMVITSKDGGATWSQPSLAAHIKWHQPNGGLRGNPMITMDTDGAGKIYLAWASCEFRTDTCSDSSNSSRNDIIYVTSTDAKTWSSPVRIPIDVSNASMERYFPELGVDKSTSGSNAKLGLHYYFYDNGGCSSATDCQLKVGYVSSANGGTSWSAPQTLAGPFPLTQIANTSSGRMIGDYIGGAMVNGKAVGVFPVGQAPADGKAFDQATYTFGPLAVTGGTVSSSPLAAKSPAAAADRQKMLQKRTG